MNRLRVTHSGCKYLRSCTAVLLLLALLSSFAVFAESGNTVNGSSTGVGKALEPATTRAQGTGRSCQIYKGEGVRLRAHQLQSSNRGIARAMKDFEKRGLEPKWDQSLTLLEPASISTATIAGRALRPVSSPQTWSDGTYELTLITYSMSSSQWEGIIYFQNPYENDTYAALITTPGLAEWDAAYEYSYPPDGGDPQCGGGECQLQGRSSSRLTQPFQTRFVNASLSPDPTVRRGIWGRIKRWAKCVWNEAVLGAYWCGDLICELGVIGSAILNC